MESSQVRNSKGEVFEGGKGISAHFGRGTRTVQLWGQECALPVHRFQKRVLAYAAELDEWRQERQVAPGAEKRRSAAERKRSAAA
jgi:hypothetical protein